MNNILIDPATMLSGLAKTVFEKLSELEIIFLRFSENNKEIATYITKQTNDSSFYDSETKCFSVINYVTDELLSIPGSNIVQVDYSLTEEMHNQFKYNAETQKQHYQDLIYYHQHY